MKSPPIFQTKTYCFDWALARRIRVQCGQEGPHAEALPEEEPWVIQRVEQVSWLRQKPVG